MLDWVKSVYNSDGSNRPESSMDRPESTTICLDAAAERQLSEWTFQGYDGATSLKAEMAGRVPLINDASTFREARELLTKLGGAEALRHELVFSGFVDPETNTLTTTEKPFNAFALMATSELSQPGMNVEQEALGEYSGKYFICANKPENDLRWDSQDPKWVAKASMGKRHRFLTTKNLHWQWFNALTFGMVSPGSGGSPPRDAVQEVECMKAAALLYCKNVGGWSDNIGLFVNVFGHNNVNSLFVHILDCDELGPGFEFHEKKNCPLDAVLKVLREEAVNNLLPSPPKNILLLPGFRGHTKASAFFFPGTEGATSLKEELVARVPTLKDASGYREARRLLQKELGGWETLFEELRRSGFVDPETNELTVGTAPFNVFARIVAGEMKQPGLEADQQFLGRYQEKLMVASNRPDADEHWDSQSPAWVGKASMSRRHKFLLLKDTHWQWFNALVLGMVPSEQQGVSIKAAIATLELMKAAALTYCANKGGWSQQVGLFFHVFGHNSVNSLHLHVLDMSELGPSFWFLESKNCPLDEVLRVLKEELSTPENAQGDTKLYDESRTAARAASEAAASAKATMNAVNNMVKQHSRRFSVGAEEQIKLRREEEEGSGILQLNVGGELVDVPRETVLLAPKGSVLSSMFDDSWTGTPLATDASGRIFLNFPPRSFKYIVNHLRLLHSSSPDDEVKPIVVPFQFQSELEELAWLLGVGDLISKPQKGKGSSPRRTGPRPKVLTAGGNETSCLDRLIGSKSSLLL